MKNLDIKELPMKNLTAKNLIMGIAAAGLFISLAAQPAFARYRDRDYVDRDNHRSFDRDRDNDRGHGDWNRDNDRGRRDWDRDNDRGRRDWDRDRGHRYVDRNTYYYYDRPRYCPPPVYYYPSTVYYSAPVYRERHVYVPPCRTYRSHDWGFGLYFGR